MATLTWETTKDKMLVGTASLLVSLCGFGVYQLQRISEQVTQLNLNLVVIQTVATQQGTRIDHNSNMITELQSEVSEHTKDIAVIKERINKL